MQQTVNQSLMTSIYQILTAMCKASWLINYQQIKVIRNFSGSERGGCSSYLLKKKRKLLSKGLFFGH